MNKKVAIVTGGTRGIGLGIVKAFLADGYQVAVNYRDDDQQADEALKQLDSEDARLIKADVTDPDAREQLLQQTLARFGQFDVLINNAAIIRMGRFLDISPQIFSDVMDCNFYAPIYLAQSFAQQLIESERTGSIVNVLSVGAYGAGNISYCTSKAALLFASKCMAKELAKHQIRVNSVSPNGVPTDLNQWARDASPEKWQAAIERIPLKREGTPADVAGAVLYLASEAANYITGIDIPVEGGLLC